MSSSEKENNDPAQEHLSQEGENQPTNSEIVPAETSEVERNVSE